MTDPKSLDTPVKPRYSCDARHGKRPNREEMDHVLRADQLNVDRAMVLVVDLQENLLPLVRGPEEVIAAGRKLLDGARLFQLPVLATEQYAKGIGPTVAPIRDALKTSRATILEKAAFSAWAEPEVRDAMLTIDRPQVIVIGIEAHVCVQQTALDLVSRDYDVFVCADAVGSRGAADYERSLDRMRQGGVFVTTVESVLFELCSRCDTRRFKAMLELIKAAPPGRGRSVGEGNRRRDDANP